MADTEAAGSIRTVGYLTHEKGLSSALQQELGSQVESVCHSAGK